MSKSRERDPAFYCATFDKTQALAERKGLTFEGNNPLGNTYCYWAVVHLCRGLSCLLLEEQSGQEGNPKNPVAAFYNRLKQTAKIRGIEI